ncbi:MAG: FHA domain-containing protein [Pirellulaceae bacterium]|nr:FHA domain-containing protein [Planctomycetales bacterium]
MTNVTLRILDGADRGRVYDDLEPPITIGREEGNTIQLNDDRVSRFHVKIQEDHEKLVLTDLESTNGTKVNGEEIQLRILRYGDIVTIGRSVLLFGSRDQIATRLAKLRGANLPTVDPDDPNANRIEDAVSLDFELNWSEDEDLHATLHTIEPPELPERLGAGQAAQLSELLEYLHIRIRQLLASVQVDDERNRITLSQRQWQNLVDLQARLAGYLRAISEPDDPNID